VNYDVQTGIGGGGSRRRRVLRTRLPGRKARWHGLREWPLGQPRLPDPRMADPIADVHPEAGFGALDAVDDGVIGGPDGRTLFTFIQ